MRIVLEQEAYAKFEAKAKARNITTRELGKEVLTKFLTQ